jgi:hypothetical protein
MYDKKSRCLATLFYAVCLLGGLVWQQRDFGQEINEVNLNSICGQQLNCVLRAIDDGFSKSKFNITWSS